MGITDKKDVIESNGRKSYGVSQLTKGDEKRVRSWLNGLADKKIRALLHIRLKIYGKNIRNKKKRFKFKKFTAF